MPISVQPLDIRTSFEASRVQAQDKVDLVQLDAVFTEFANKINEIIDAVNTTQRDDDTLSDGAIEFRNLNDDVVSNISQLVNDATTT